MMVHATAVVNVRGAPVATMIATIATTNILRLVLFGWCIPFATVRGFGHHATFVSSSSSSFAAATTTTTTTTSLGLGDFFKNPFSSAETSASDTAETTTTTTTTTDATDDDDGGEVDEVWEDDPVDKIFNFFFGKKEDAPMGMARFGPDRFPEQYPATTTEWAAPLESDRGDADATTMRPFLKNTNLEKRALRLTYDANRDGWDASVFHRAVDRQGGAVVLCRVRDSGLVCGGYNPKGWVGYGEARGSIAAFLFTVGNGDDADAPGVKLRKVGGPGLAQMDYPESGPSFGADSLVIPLDASGKGDPRTARSKLGSYYERFADGTNSLFGKNTAMVRLKDLRVFHGVYEEGEFVPHTDAEPFALY